MGGPMGLWMLMSIITYLHKGESHGLYYPLTVSFENPWLAHVDWIFLMHLRLLLLIILQGFFIGGVFSSISHWANFSMITWVFTLIYYSGICNEQQFHNLNIRFKLLSTFDFSVILHPTTLFNILSVLICMLT